MVGPDSARDIYMWSIDESITMNDQFILLHRSAVSPGSYSNKDRPGFQETQGDVPGNSYRSRALQMI